MADPTRNSADLFATLAIGESVDLQGETIAGADVDNPPDGVTITNGVFLDQTQIYSGKRMTFQNCKFVGGNERVGLDHGLLRMLGGDSWMVSACEFDGGVVDSQLGVGLNLRETGAGYPKNWTISDCVFNTLNGQWGDYPMGHQCYVLADPSVNINGRIENCIFSGSPYGAPLKLGGTGNQPHTEGTRGVIVDGCSITGRLDTAGRILTVLTQGEKTDVTVKNCTLLVDPEDGNVQPWVQAMDGARLRMESTILPFGVKENATYFQLYFIKKSVSASSKPGAKPPSCGKITWA